MKKISILMTIVLLIVTCGNVQVAKAYEDDYRYDVVQDGSETPRKAWFKNGSEIQGNPEVIEEQSQITIATTPDDSCAAYLATFSEPTSRVTVEPGVTVTFGSLENATSIQGLTCYDANVTIYAEGGEFQEDGSLPGSVYGVTCFNSTVCINGNVQYLCLGDEFKYDSVKENEGNVVVNGSVYDVQWHTTSEYTQGSNGIEYYRGFIGDASVSGTVGRITMYEIKHSNVLGTDIKATIAEGRNLTSFNITEGVLSEETKAEEMNTIETDMESFYYEYAPMSDGSWLAIARYSTGGETGFYKDITADEIGSILENGTGRVVLERDENARADISNYNLSELKVYRGGISVNNVTADGNGFLMVHSYGREYIDVNVNGNVDKLQINFTRSNENMNINVNGKVNSGDVYKFSLQSDFPIYLGSFTCSDMEIYKDGIWNPNLFLSLGTTEYHPVDENVLDAALGLEKNIQNGSETVSQMADMFIEEVESNVLGELESDTDFSTCIDEYEDAKVLTGVEIELQKFDYNETTGEVSNKQVVTELGDKDLGITVKVPEDKFEEGKEYIIVREHDNHGTKEMDVLVPRRDGDKLTFKTNKFSSFIIVEVADNFEEDDSTGGSTDDTGNEGENEDGNKPDNKPEDDSLDKKEENIVVELKDNSVVSKTDFISILEENKTKDVEIKLNNYVSFIFAKGSMKTVEGMKKYDFTVTISETYKSDLPSYITKDNFVAIIDYNYSGKLPGQANIKISVGKEYVGKTLYYSLMKDDNTFDEVQAVVADSDGFITVKQDHCSSYVITTVKPKLNETTTPNDTEKPSSPDTGDSATIWLFILVGVLAMGTVIGTRKYKRV